MAGDGAKWQRRARRMAMLDGFSGVDLLYALLVLLVAGVMPDGARQDPDRDPGGCCLSPLPAGGEEVKKASRRFRYCACCSCRHEGV